MTRMESSRRPLAARALAAGMLAASLALHPLSAFAGIEKAGTTAANFLAVGSGADVLGMGGATLGFGSGLGAAAWNIAALGSLSQTEYVFAHSSLSGASPQDWIAAGGRFGPSATRWGLTGLYQGDGSFEGRDVNNLSTGSFSASSLALGVQLAQAVGDAVSVGLGAKYASERLGDVTGGGVTFDAGVRVQAGPLGLGAAAQNAFGKMSYSGAAYDFPTSYGLGASYQIPTSGLTVALDANMPSAYFNDVRGGLEWRYHDRVALRGGYRKELGAGDGEPLGGPTFGMGAGSNGFWFDYGFLTGGASGSGQHRMSLTYHPGFMNASSPAATSTVAGARVARSASEVKEKKSKPVATKKTKASPGPNVASQPASSNTTSPNSAAAVKPSVTIPAAPAPTVATRPAPTSPPNMAPAENSPRTTQAVRTPVPPVVAAPAPINNPVAHPASRLANPTPAPAAPAPAKPAAVAQSPVAPPAAMPAPIAPKPAPPASSAPTTNSAPTAPPVATPAPQKPASAPAPAAPTPPAESAPAKSAPVEAAPAKPAVEEKPAPPPVATPAPREEKPAPPPPAPAKAEPRPDKIKVKSGETLETIAKRWGTTVPALMMENDLVSEKVKPGQTLKLPPAR